MHISISHMPSTGKSPPGIIPIIIIQRALQSYISTHLRSVEKETHQQQHATEAPDDDLERARPSTVRGGSGGEREGCVGVRCVPRTSI